jgi:HEAT repeat protein
VPTGIYQAVAKKNHAEMTVFINDLKPVPPKDAKQIEKWIRDLDDDAFKTRDMANKELAKLGKDAKPLVREALKSERSPESRHRLEALLGRLHELNAKVDVADLDIPKGTEIVTVDDLLADAWRDLKETDANVCGGAIQELSRFASYDAKIVPALIEMLKKDKNEYVRRVAASCLAHLGVTAKVAVPALKEGLNDQDTNIRDAFQAALERIENAKDQPDLEERVKRELAILKEINEFKKAAGGSK